MFALVGAVSARSSLVVKTKKDAALTAVLSIDPDGWLDEFGALMAASGPGSPATNRFAMLRG